MSTHTATREVATRAETKATYWRQRLLMALGPFVALLGVVWAIAQPYRVTLLHPHGQGFWWLFVEPPLLVVLAGALFYVFVARDLIDDMAEE